MSATRPSPGRPDLRAVSVALALVLAAAPGAALAGNRYSYLFGARAAGMGGAFTAIADDGSAAWYNPAALSTQDRHSFDLSASAYGFEILDVPGMVETKLGGRTKRSDYSTTGLQIIPTTLDAVYRVSAPGAQVRHALAFSVLVPQMRELEQTFEFEEELVRFRQKMDIAESRTRYYVGPSYGVALNEIVSVGASLFVVYDDLSTNVGLFFHEDRDENRDLFALINLRQTGTDIGFMIAGAVQVRLGRFRLAAVARSPIVRMYSAFENATSAAFADPDQPVGPPDAPGVFPSTFAEESNAPSGFGLDLSGPAEISLGFGYDSPGRWRIGADVRWHSPYDDQGVSYRNTFNAAVGAEVYLTRSLPFAFGLFTDLHPEAKITGFNERQVDYFGGTLALTLLSPYDVAGSEKTDRITFATTLGFHYAYGFGEIVGFEMDWNQVDYDFPRRKATAHDVHVTVGSMVRF